MSSLNTSGGAPIGRRQFLGFAGSRGVALGMTGLTLPTLLAACGDDDDGGVVGAGGDGTTTSSEVQATDEARAIVGDVVDFRPDQR